MFTANSQTEESEELDSLSGTALPVVQLEVMGDGGNVESGGRTIQSVDRAMLLLQLLGRHGGDLSLNDFAKAAGVHKSTVHRLLASLQEAGLVYRNPTTARYELGLEMVALGGVVLGRLEVLRIADPHLRRLAEETRLTVHLGVRYEDEILPVEQIPGPGAVRRFDWMGLRRPLHMGATAKVLLANLTDTEITTYLAGPNGQTFATDHDAFRDELRQIRRQGVAVHRGESEGDVGSVAAAIFNRQGHACAGLSVAGPWTEFVDTRINELIAPVRDTAAIISRQLGYHGWGPQSVSL